MSKVKTAAERAAMFQADERHALHACAYAAHRAVIASRNVRECRALLQNIGSAESAYLRERAAEVTACLTASEQAIIHAAVFIESERARFI